MEKQTLEKETFLNLVNVYNRLVDDVSVFIDSFGLTISQFDVLDIIGNAESQGLPLSKICEKLRSRKPDATRLVDRLEAVGLVTRIRDVKDRRVVFAKLTKKGLETLNEIYNSLNDIHKKQFSCFSKKELAAFNKFLLIKRNASDPIKIKSAKK